MAGTSVLAYFLCYNIIIHGNHSVYAEDLLACSSKKLTAYLNHPY